MMQSINTISKHQVVSLWLIVNIALVGFLGWGLYSSYIGYRIEIDGENADGKVVDLLFLGHGTYSMFIEFEVNGKTYSFRDGRTHDTYNDAIGKTVIVRYDRSNPKFAQLDDTVFPLWLVPSFLSAQVLLVIAAINLKGWSIWKRTKGSIDMDW
jgi:hypothetical protein